MNVAAAVAVKPPPLRGDALAHAAGRPPGAAGSKLWTDGRPTKEKKVPETTIPLKLYNFCLQWLKKKKKKKEREREKQNGCCHFSEPPGMLLGMLNQS